MIRSVGGGRQLSKRNEACCAAGQKSRAAACGAMRNSPANESSATRILAGVTALKSEGDSDFLQPTLWNLALPVGPAWWDAWQQQHPCGLLGEVDASPSDCEQQPP